MSARADVEVGGGSGNFKQFAPDVLSFDIVNEPWLDFVADAQECHCDRRALRTSSCSMYFITSSIQFDFLREAARALQPGGRVIFVEPGITPLSGIVYRALHEEPVDTSVDPLAEGMPRSGQRSVRRKPGDPELCSLGHLRSRVKRWSHRWI